MIAGNISAEALGWLVIATGILGLLGLIFIILFFTLGQPFGTFNDISIGLTALLSAFLVWAFYLSKLRQSFPISPIILILAMIGVILVLVGSFRAITGISGWYLSGLYMAAGNALLCPWLLSLNMIACQTSSWPKGIAVFGLVSGGLLLLGFVAIPGIFRGTDLKTYDVTLLNVLWWTSTLGWLLFYPIWCIWLGLELMK